ncbi:TetR/AcrR family transcriptional regulator [Georgenia deserti]|uniref:TetR/AcrR family transcriptional regulator n=1 Tax=Georgenia deserti TaxID=2093781 RepID=A0ABW4L3R1_9MICO
MPGIRERVRAELVAEIVEVARRHLGERGAAGLSVRAVTRELGMAPSAVYRYFPNRDALLTALIVSAYEGLGAAAREAESGVDREDHLGRWHAVFRAVRAWALTHRHEYALIYGTPVPGYVAPEDTVGPAAQVTLLLAGIVTDAAVGPGLAEHESVPVPQTLQSDVDARIADVVRTMAPEQTASLRALRPDTVLGVIDAWSALFGAVSFELFGHYHRVIEAREAHIEHLARTTARTVGLPGA